MMPLQCCEAEGTPRVPQAMEGAGEDARGVTVHWDSSVGSRAGGHWKD